MAAILKFKNTVRVPKSCIIAVAFINAVNACEIEVDQWVTSGNDSIHMGTSKHYHDEALDFRCKQMSALTKKVLIKEFSRRLGKDYQVILENEGKPNEHIHCEYDPKN